jgi:hypothetical protein
VSAPEQCAESQVRAELGETRIGALWAHHAVATDTGHVVTVTHADNRSWQVEVVRHESGQRRAESCGKNPVEVAELRAQILSATF